MKTFVVRVDFIVEAVDAQHAQRLIDGDMAVVTSKYARVPHAGEVASVEELDTVRASIRP